jgi:hypothetical protein
MELLLLAKALGVSMDDFREVLVPRRSSPGKK